MKPTALEMLLTSKTRRRLVAEMYGKGRHDSVRRFALSLDLPYGHTHAEINRLHEAGLLTKEKRGNATVFGPMLTGDIAGALTRLAVDHVRIRENDGDVPIVDVTEQLKRKAGVLKYVRKLREAHVAATT